MWNLRKLQWKVQWRRSSMCASAQAKTILGVADKLIALGRRGIKDTRGRHPSVIRPAVPVPAADVKVEGDKAPVPDK